MTRERWFCCLCGAMTVYPAWRDGRYYCRAHADLFDREPPDPLRSLPMQAADTGEDLTPAAGMERC